MSRSLRYTRLFHVSANGMLTSSSCRENPFRCVGPSLRNHCAFRLCAHTRNAEPTDQGSSLFAQIQSASSKSLNDQGSMEDLGTGSTKIPIE
eukprot:3630365-Prymnesium_polylepis.1